jgi:hypothetical protein
MKPPKVLIDEALASADTRPSGWESYLTILAAAYRAALARAELAERQYREATERVYTYSWGPETSSDMLERHERERKELET